MSQRRLALFDIDGTLTEHRKVEKEMGVNSKTISIEMKDFLHSLHSVVDIGFVGGASYDKHIVQLTPEGIILMIVVISDYRSRVFVFSKWWAGV